MCTAAVTTPTPCATDLPRRHLRSPIQELPQCRGACRKQPPLAAALVISPSGCMRCSPPRRSTPLLEPSAQTIVPLALKSGSNTMRACFNRSRSLHLLSSKLFQLKAARHASIASVTRPCSSCGRVGDTRSKRCSLACRGQRLRRRVTGAVCMARFSAQEALRQKRSAHLSPQSATHDTRQLGQAAAFYCAS